MPTKAKEQSSLVSSMEVGSLGVFHLKRLWSRMMAARKGHVCEEDGNEWVFDNIVIHGLGLALEETLQYLYQDAPTYCEFERWVLRKNEGSIGTEQIDRINSAARSGSRDWICWACSQGRRPFLLGREWLRDTSRCCSRRKLPGCWAVRLGVLGNGFLWPGNVVQETEGTRHHGAVLWPPCSCNK